MLFHCNCNFFFEFEISFIDYIFGFKFHDGFILFFTYIFIRQQSYLIYPNFVVTRLNHLYTMQMRMAHISNSNSNSFNFRFFFICVIRRATTFLHILSRPTFGMANLEQTRFTDICRVSRVSVNVCSVAIQTTLPKIRFRKKMFNGSRDMAQKCSFFVEESARC